MDEIRRLQCTNGQFNCLAIGGSEEGDEQLAHDARDFPAEQLAANHSWRNVGCTARSKAQLMHAICRLNGSQRIDLVHFQDNDVISVLE